MRRWSLIVLVLVCVTVLLVGVGNKVPVTTLIFCCLMLTISTSVMAFLLLVPQKEKKIEELSQEDKTPFDTPFSIVSSSLNFIFPCVGRFPSITGFRFSTLAETTTSEREAEKDREIEVLRSCLAGSEALVARLLEESEEKQELLAEKDEQFEQLQEQIANHPLQFDYRQLRKQFAEKADTLHRLRQQMFSIEGDLLVIKREQEEAEAEKTEQIAQLIQALGEAEEEHDLQEKHIQLLEEHVQYPTPKKRNVKKKNEAIQTDLFPTPVTVTPRVRKKRVKNTSLASSNLNFEFIA